MLGDESESPIIVRYDEQPEIEVQIDHDGTKAYAYLFVRGRVATAVWLYNVPPVVSVTEMPEDGPPQNPAALASDEPFEPIHSADEVEATFARDDEDWVAYIFIRSRLHAYLSSKYLSGWCILAKRTGPFAKRMSAEKRTDGTWELTLDRDSKGTLESLL